MKVCNFCGQRMQDHIMNCPSCGGSDFSSFCLNCGTVFNNSNYCPSCGVKAGQTGKSCPQCGKIYFSFACPDCGYTPNRTNAAPPSVATQTIYIQTPPPGYAPQYISAPIESDKSKWVAFILCLFLGPFGIHYFYVGKVGTGIIYLLTFGAFGIGWLIDCIRIIAGGFKDRYGRKLL